MTQTEWKPRTQRVIEVIPQEIDDLERAVQRFRSGEFDPNDFMAFRLKQGVYGQRQPDAQMFRIKIPFGGLTADQLDALGDGVARFAPLRKGHVTTRENIQVHHIKLEDAPAFMRVIGEVGLTSREACGNTVRNVTGCPHAGVAVDEEFDATPYAAAYVRYFVRHPYTQALPRKFKTAFASCSHNCVMTAIHDLGFIPRIVDGKRGFKMVTGGGTSIMPRLADTLYEFVPLDQYLKVSEAVLRVFHHCDELRKNRAKARMKFFVARVGIDEFRRLVEEQLQQPWAQRSFDPTPLMFVEDEAKDAPPLGAAYSSNGHSPEFQRWVATSVEAQRQQGYVMVQVKLPQGDITAEQFHKLADIARRYAGGRARTTPEQNLVFRWVPEAALSEVWQRLTEIGLGDAGAREITDVVSCPGTDSCKLGITSSMGLNRAIVEALAEVDTSDPLVKKMHIKMSGCPNGCGQHHVADIGFHGAAAKGPGGQVPAYELFLGGSYDNGDARFGLRVKTKIPAKMAPEALKKVIAYYQQNRNEGEEFKDFALRTGAEPFEHLLEELKEVPELNRDTISYYIDWDKTVKYRLERGEGECAV